MDNLGFKSRQGKRFFSSPKHPDWPWSSPSLLFSEYWGSFSEIRLLGHELNHSSPSSLRFRMSGAMPLLPSPHMPSWHMQQQLYRYLFQLCLFFRMNTIMCMKSSLNSLSFCCFMHIDVSLLVDQSLQANCISTLFLFIYMNSVVKLVQ